MRQYDLPHLEGLDPDTRAAAEKAAHRAGQSLEDWIAAIMIDEMGKPDSASPARPAPRHPAADSDAAARRPKAFPAPASGGPIPRAATADRPPQSRPTPTAAALESIARWIERTDERLNETARASSVHQDQMAMALSETLSALRSRVDAVERRAAEPPPARVEFPVEEAMKVLSPLAETLTGLRADVSQLAHRLDQPGGAGVEDIRGEIGRLRSDLTGLATRSEVATLDETLRLLLKDLEMGPSSKDLLTLAGSVAGLQRRVQGLAEETADDLHRRIGAEIDLVKHKIDRVAETGVDRTVVDFLSSQILDLRHDLARRAEPQDIEHLSGEVAALGRQLAEMRADQVGRSDFAALKSSLEGVSAALNRSVAAQEAGGGVPEQLEGMNRRLDLLASRPASGSVDLGPITSQLAVLTDRMAGIADGRQGQSDALTATLDRLTSEIRMLSDGAPALQGPLLQRFDRLESELRQIGRQADTSTVELMLRSVQERLGPSSADGPAPAGSSHHADVAEIAERAARAALRDILPSVPAPDDLDALKAGFVELKALQSRADRKTQQTLQSVHDALETLLARFAGPGAAPTVGAPPPFLASRESSDGWPSAERLEAAVHRLHAATLSQVEDVASAADELPPADAAAAPHQEPDLGHIRASFIAAARRASQSHPLLQEDGDLPYVVSLDADDASYPEPDAEPSEPVLSLIERIRRAFDSHRRPVLFGFALLILTAGTAQILSGGVPTFGAAGTAEASLAVEQKTAALPAPQDTTGSIRTTAVGENEAGRFEPASLTTPPDATSTFAAAPPAAPAPPVVAAPSTADRAKPGEIPAEVPEPLRKAALAGDTAALYEVAMRAVDGRGQPQDYALAVRLLDKAAQAGLAPAQARLALMYDKGIGTPRDAKLAVTWYRRAAEAGNIRAMHSLATLMAAGIDGKPDYAAAMQWYKEAAQAGLRDSQFNMGILYATGIVTQQDLTKSYLWFALASAQGDPEATRKRDEVAAHLTATELKTAKALVARWHPRPVDPAANDVKPVADRTADLDKSAQSRS